VRQREADQHLLRRTGPHCGGHGERAAHEQDVQAAMPQGVIKKT